MKNVYFRIRWSVSRGRDTYGYNICTVECNRWGIGNIKGQCKGGGYDMVATSLAEALSQIPVISNALYTLLEANPHRAGSVKHTDRTIVHNDSNGQDVLYGTWLNLAKGYADFDGGCGLNSLVRAYEAAGVEIVQDHDRKGRTVGFFVSWDDAEDGQ